MMPGTGYLFVAGVAEVEQIVEIRAAQAVAQPGAVEQINGRDIIAQGRFGGHEGWDSCIVILDELEVY